jgi:NADH-quinone oxidoreductase subunit G
MGTVLVDGKEVTLAPGEKINGIQAAERVGVEIPRYCWHAGLTVVASCRMCLVESGRVNDKTGKVEMQPKLVPACQTPATDGTVFVTNTEKVKNARAMVEEDLLIRHPIDCSICDKAGECSLQDYHFEHGRDERRADIQPFTSRRRSMGDTVTLFVDRCVMCTRCVRFTREIAGTSELMVINRGAHEEIDVFPGFPLENKLSGNVVDLCPVGALGDKDFLYSQRVWFMKSRDNVCANCSTGCSIKVEENQDRIYRLKPRENPHVNQWWMCDEGRYGWKHVHSEHRLLEPRRRVGANLVPVEWHQVAEQVESEFAQAGRLAAVLSPQLTVEEAYLLATYVRRIDSQAVIAVGPIPVVGHDETFKNGFTIRAEKCPNRRGVEKMASSFMNGELIGWSGFLDRLASDVDRIRGVWVSGGYAIEGQEEGRTAWNDADTVARFANVTSLVVQDCFPTPLSERATLQLPGATFAEREGSYVNFNDRLQSFSWAIRPPTGVKTEGQLLWALSRREGLYKAAKVLDDVGREVAFFAPALGGVGEHGVDLRVNMIAEAATPAATV